MESNELRLFVSSTFRDLQPEREQLVKKTFPRIRAACRERGVEFTEIDLRWGITEDESRTGKTIRICLEEIDRCSPYFIGIIGSRYGWIPGVAEIEKDNELLKQYPWLHEYANADKSIVEMEFAHGAMLRKNDSAFFYEQCGVHPPDEALDALKDALRSTGIPYRRFTIPDELGEQVFQDLLAILDRDWPMKKELTPLERERIKHEAFARNRRHSYVANPEYYAALEDHISSDGPPFMVWGSSGLGKSALMAYLAHEYQSRNPNAFVIQHFIGSSDDTNSDDVIRHIMLEIKARFGLADEIPADDQKLREDFPLWLAKVDGQNPLLLNEGGKLILFIDALNQLTGIAPEMHWLPEFIPPNVRLVVSTTPEMPLEQLRKRNWKELEMLPLTSQQVEKISETFLAQYHKTLTLDQLLQISSEEKSRRPLFLRTLLEEVRVFGSHSTLSNQLKRYLDSEDEPGLFQLVLARMEEDHGAEEVRSVMSAIWAARHGLSETEIMEITKLPRMKLSALLIAMEYHLMQREELYTFFHNYLREGIQTRYIATEDDQKAAHSKLGEYFSTREYGYRRRDEEPWQWQKAIDSDRLRECIASHEMVELLMKRDDRNALYRYWNSAGLEEMPSTYRAAYINQLPHCSLQELGEFAEFIGDILLFSNHLTSAEKFLQIARTISIQIHGERSTQCASVLEKLANLLLQNGMIRNGITYLEQARSVQLELGDRVKAAGLLISISSLYFHIQEYEKAWDACSVAEREMSGTSREEAHEHAIALTNMGTLKVQAGELDKAEEYLTRAHRELSKLHGVTNPDVVLCLQNLGMVQLRSGETKRAIGTFNRCLDLLRATLGPAHPSVPVLLRTLGRAYSDLGQYDSVEAIHLEALRIQERVLPANHHEIAAHYIAIATSYFKRGRAEEAEALYRQYAENRERALGSQHPFVIQGKRNFIEILRALGKAEEANAIETSL